MEQHRAYEGVAFFPSWLCDRYGYRGFRLVKDYRCFAYVAAERSHKYYTQALQTPPPREVTEKTWDDAVNDTASLWMSIFCRALGPEKSLRLYGIPAPKEEVGKR